VAHRCGLAPHPNAFASPPKGERAFVSFIVRSVAAPMQTATLMGGTPPRQSSALQVPAGTKLSRQAVKTTLVARLSLRCRRNRPQRAAGGQALVF
jgi:hypothetical protein